MREKQGRVAERREGRGPICEGFMDDARRIGVPVARRRFLWGAAAAMAGPSLVQAAGDSGHALNHAGSTKLKAHLAEHAGSRDGVELYYQAAVFAYAAMAADPTGRESGRAMALYNECLAGCLRVASRHRAIDPRSSLVLRTSRGEVAVPIVHRGFVWSPSEFHGLIPPSTAPRNPSNARDHTRAGLGAPQVVRRCNPQATAADAFLPTTSYFPATAALRPDLDAWLNGGGPGPGDVLELVDPLRVGCVEGPGAGRPLAYDLDAPIAFLEHETIGPFQSGWEGLVNPSQDPNRAFLNLLEPFQPGKTPVVFVHGLYDSPYTFTDLMNGLRLRPGFLDRYQIVGYRYPTGLTFLHTAALFRRDMYRFAAAVDPAQADPGVQNSVLVGHSMGGLVMKTLMVSSGCTFWNQVCNRPLEALATAEQSRASLSALFFFEPVPTIRRAIFVATPHNGLSAAAQPGGVITEALTRRPRDLDGLIGQLNRDNPGAILPYMHDLPNCIGMLRRREPTHRALRDLAIDPAIQYHTIAGTGRILPAAISHGDGVVPVGSAHHEGAASETLVPETHTTINPSEYTLVEVERILRLHAGS
ncbi:esterase/lipase family protein [Paludisphaera rhizosphaerae]|uniref:esterase/lipase family protein n=1 Tax=Paludisphaera rhizosphaerae TaxID=2711216 RepID=UPI0013EC0EC0|nr:alpha/beta fold hydrolase [Paludisphaera rhizosphaerae]